MTWTSVKTNRYIREDMTFLPQWVKVWHLYSKFLKRLQIYFLNQISNYCMHSKLKLTTWHLINKDFLKWINSFSDFSSVVQSCPTLYEPMYCSMPGLPVHHQLPELAQTHVHWVGDATVKALPALWMGRRPMGDLGRMSDTVCLWV